MPLILNIETATGACSVNLAQDGNLIASKESNEERSHSEQLTVFIRDMFTGEGIKATDLDAVSVSKGPGSYTGLRIGVSVAKGICFAADIPLLSVSTLRALAKGILEHPDIKSLDMNDTLLCPMIDARRMEVYSALYDQKNKLKREIVAEIIMENSYNDILLEKVVVFFGNGSDKCKNILNKNNALFISDIYPSSEDMIMISEEAFKEKKFEDIAYFEPFYLKDFVATVPKKNIFPQC